MSTETHFFLQALRICKIAIVFMGPELAATARKDKELLGYSAPRRVIWERVPPQVPGHSHVPGAWGWWYVAAQQGHSLTYFHFSVRREFRVRK